MISNIEIGAIVVVILTITGALKFAGVSSRFLPLIAVILGIAGGIYTGGTSWITVASGIFLGFSTSGLYDFAKITIAGKQ